MARELTELLYVELGDMTREELEIYVRSTGCAHIQDTLRRYGDDLSSISYETLLLVAQVVRDGQIFGFESAPVT